MKAEITLPSSDTQFEINVADLSVEEAAKELNLIASIFGAISEGKYYIAEGARCYVTFSGKHSFPTVGLTYRHWDSEEPDFDMNSIILGSSSNGDNTLFELDADFVNGMRKGMKIGQWCEKHFEDLSESAMEALSNDE